MGSFINSFAINTPISPPPPPIFPISLENSLGCVIDTILSNPLGTFTLSDIQINDQSGPFGVNIVPQNITIMNADIASIVVSGTCDLEINLVPCPSPFPIEIRTASGCVIANILTDPGGTFTLPNINLEDQSGPYGLTQIPQNIIIVNADILSTTSSPDGCDLEITVDVPSCSNIIPNRIIPKFYDVSSYVGDLAWQWANGTYDYNDGPGIIQELDPLAGTEYFFRLKYNNPFGNKYRFTDDMGVPAPSGRFDFPIDTVTPNSLGATPGYYVDNLAGLGWTYLPVARTRNYYDSLDLVNALTVGAYSDFRAPNEVEYLSVSYLISFIGVGIDPDQPFNRGGSGGSSFDPSGSGTIDRAWVNYEVVPSSFAKILRNFRLRIEDASPSSFTTAIGIYGVRKHF